MENNSVNLEKIANEFLKHTIATKNFDLGNFFQQMENEFRRLGYREPVRGGGSGKYSHCAH